MSQRGIQQAPIIWKTIILGLHKTSEEYSRSLQACSYRLDHAALEVLKGVPFSQVRVEVDLVRLEAAHLSFPLPRAAIYQSALEWGLRPCPAEVGPALREQYPDQPEGERNAVGMEPVSIFPGSLKLLAVDNGPHEYVDVEGFDVGIDSGRWLDTLSGGADVSWGAGRAWLFVRPRA